MDDVAKLNHILKIDNDDTITIGEVVVFHDWWNRVVPLGQVEFDRIYARRLAKEAYKLGLQQR